MNKRLLNDPANKSMEKDLERIRQTARMRAGMVAGLIVVALIQVVPDIGHESFEALVRQLAPALAVGCIGLPLVAWIARREERRLRRRRLLRS